MSDFGGWAIDVQLFLWMEQNIASGSRVVELGSGKGTGPLSETYELTSIEHNLQWLGYCPTTSYVHAPLVDGWYDAECVEHALEQSGDYVAVLIDGPPGAFRKGMADYLDIFNKDAIYIVDDAQRPGEQWLMGEMNEWLGYKPVMHNCDKGSFAVYNPLDRGE